MGTKIRKQIYIDPEHEEMLKKLAQDSGRPEAELIRDALDQQLNGAAPIKRSFAAWQEIEAFLAERLQQGSISGAREWKREDLYDR